MEEKRAEVAIIDLLKTCVSEVKDEILKDKIRKVEDTPDRGNCKSNCKKAGISSMKAQEGKI